MMGAAEVIATIAFLVGMPWVIFAGFAKVKRASAPEGAALRASELEALIRAAVEDAVEPMRQRVETLEAIVTDDEPGGGRLDPAVLADVLEPDEPAASAAGRRRTRA